MHIDSTRKLVMSTSINDDQRLLLEQASDISVERPPCGSTADSCANRGLSDDESGDTASSDDASMDGEPGYHKPRDDDVRDSTEDDDDAYVLKRSNLSYIQKRQHDRSSYRSGKPTIDDTFIHQIAAFKSANIDDNIGYFFFSVNDPTNSTSFIPILTTDATLIKDPYSSSTTFKYLYSCHVLIADIKTVPIGYVLSSWEKSMFSYNVFCKRLRAARGYQFDFDAM